jgi:acetyltransferase
MIAQTRLAKRLAGYRGRKPADLAALSRVLVALSRLATDLPEVTELDVNPLICDADGVLAVDARVALKRVTAATPRPAILPYPSELTRMLATGGERLTLRAVRPADAGALAEMVDRSDPDDVHLRFRGALRPTKADLLLQLTQLDYDRHLALVLEDARGAFLGVGRLVCDPRGGTAEFALMVRSDRQRRGLGHILLRALLDYATARGLREVWGDVGYDNNRMLEVARSLGFDAQGTEDPARLRAARAVGAP